MSAILFRIARWPISRWLIGWVFAYMSFLIPVERLRETESLFAFYHPRPSYAFHVLIVPKRKYADLLAVQPNDPFLNDLLIVTQSLVQEFDLEQSGYRLITNGGKFQDVPHLHFHLITG